MFRSFCCYGYYFLVDCDQECCRGQGCKSVSSCPAVARLTLKLSCRLTSLLEQLSSQEREIVAFRYFSGDGSCCSSEAIRRFYGISSERARQIETAAICKLRRLASGQKSSESQTDASSSKTQDGAVEKTTAKTNAPQRASARSLKFEGFNYRGYLSSYFPFCNFCRLLNECDDECLKLKRGPEDCPFIMSEMESMKQRLLHLQKLNPKEISERMSRFIFFDEEVSPAERRRKIVDKCLALAARRISELEAELNCAGDASEERDDAQD